jgi:hypothetical protein
MNDAKEEFGEKRMKMWKMKEELLNSMSDKELRAFIKGYMMAERMVFKQLNAMNGCGCSGGCQTDSSYKGESCGCGNKDCGCGKE